MTTYPTGSRGFNSSFRGASAPSAFYAVFTSDFGEPAPAAPVLTYEAGSGSLATTTAHVKVTWITAEGVSLPSTDAAASIDASSGAVQVAQPTVPTSGATIIGWQVYSQGSATVKLNTTGTTPAPSTISTNQGNVTGFPIATTTVLVTTYGTGAFVPTIDHSGIQAAFPSVPANSGVDYDFIVPNTGSQWKSYKPVQFQRPNGVPETTGIAISANLDCISPLYPGATPGSSTYTQASVPNGTYMVMNGTLFQATQAGTQNTAATFIGAAAFANIAKGSTVTDGSVTWTSLGKAVLVRAHFVNATGSAAYPAQQQYDLFEL